MKNFSLELKHKWESTLNLNVSNELKSLWKLATIFNPYRKDLVAVFEDDNLKYDFAYLCKQFIEPSEIEEIKQKIREYLLENVPENQIEVLDFWKNAASRFPKLSNVATNCLSIGSCEAERAFSALRHIQSPEKSKLTLKHLKMYLMVYFNNKLQNT